MWNEFKLLSVIAALVPMGSTDLEPRDLPALESHNPTFVVADRVLAEPVLGPSSQGGNEVLAAAPVDDKLEKVLDGVQKAYEDTRDFSASFTQRYTYTVLRKTQESKGSVVFKKPGHMRWDYEAPTKKSFVVKDGELWVYQPEDGTALVDRCFKQDGLTASVSFLWGSGNLKAEFDAAWFSGQFGTASDHHIQLTPKTANNVFKRLILVVDPVSMRVKQSVVVDPQGNVNQFIFDALKYNGDVKDTAFALEMPKGTHVSRIPGSCTAPKVEGGSSAKVKGN